jgi:hypothetical protein
MTRPNLCIAHYFSETVSRHRSLVLLVDVRLRQGKTLGREGTAWTLLREGERSWAGTLLRVSEILILTLDGQRIIDTERATLGRSYYVTWKRGGATNEVYSETWNLF